MAETENKDMNERPARQFVKELLPRAIWLVAGLSWGFVVASLVLPSKNPTPHEDGIAVASQKTVSNVRKIDSGINILDAQRAKLQKDRKDVLDAYRAKLQRESKRLDSMESVLYSNMKAQQPSSQNRQATPCVRLPIKR